MSARDLSAETLLSLPQAACKIPSFRAGKPVSAQCIWRWIRQGVRVPDVGVVRLEGIRLAGRWLTSAEALSRFVAAQQPVDAEETPTPTRTDGQRRRASERAAKKLDKLGI